jgi:hypothetical protein
MMMFVLYFYNLFFDLKSIFNTTQYTENKDENSKYIYYKNFENYFIKPIFYIVSYSLLMIMILLFSIVKIIKYTIELLMDFIDSDETKLYDRIIYNN